MTNAQTSDLTIREPAQAELDRVLYLFRMIPLSAGLRPSGF